jgi:hypothetical protein
MLFMAIANILGIKCIFRKSIGNYRDEDGKLVVNYWNHKKTVDYLHYMKFEVFLFNW